MRLEFSGKSDKGKNRQMNQDAICMHCKNESGLFAVADGMGGHSNGEKASQTVMSELANWWNSFSPVQFDYDFQKMLSAMEQVIKNANHTIYTEWNQKKICGTTVTAVFIYKDVYGIVHVGDSRCYMCQCVGLWKKWTQITTDEVWENQFNVRKNGDIVKNHPNRGKLMNAVGIYENMTCRIATNIILPKTVFLLCTDGLYKYCSDRYMKNSVKGCNDRESIECTIDSLIGNVYKNGAKDNVSVIVVKCLK